MGLYTWVGKVGSSRRAIKKLGGDDMGRLSGSHVLHQQKKKRQQNGGKKGAVSEKLSRLMVAMKWTKLGLVGWKAL